MQTVTIKQLRALWEYREVFVCCGIESYRVSKRVVSMGTGEMRYDISIDGDQVYIHNVRLWQPSDTVTAGTSK